MIGNVHRNDWHLGIAMRRNSETVVEDHHFGRNARALRSAQK